MFPKSKYQIQRHVSDIHQPLTLSRPQWSWQWVFVNCYDVYEWPWNGFVVVAKGSATKTGDAVSIDLPEPGDGVSFDMAVTPHAAQQLVISAKRIDMNDGGYVQVLEPEGEGWTVLAEAPVGDGENMVIPFIPDYGNIRIAFWGRLRGLFYTICDQKQEWVAEEQLVTICDEDKDKYRWGFNGQEKVNEWAGIGNHNTAKFWEYDTRTGRRLNLDPKPKPSYSIYSTFGDNPVRFNDVLGDDWYKDKAGKSVYNKQLHGKDDMETLGLEGEYQGESLRGHTSDGKGVTGDKNGKVTYRLSDVSITAPVPQSVKEERLGKVFKKAHDNGFMPFRPVAVGISVPVTLMGISGFSGSLNIGMVGNDFGAWYSGGVNVGTPEMSIGFGGFMADYYGNEAPTLKSYMGYGRSYNMGLLMFSGSYSQGFHNYEDKAVIWRTYGMGINLSSRELIPGMPFSANYSPLTISKPIITVQRTKKENKNK